MRSVVVRQRYQICLGDKPLLRLPYYRSQIKAQRHAARVPLQGATWTSGPALQVVPTLTIAIPLSRRLILGYRALRTRYTTGSKLRHVFVRPLGIFGIGVLMTVMLMLVGANQSPLLFSCALLSIGIAGGAMAYACCQLAGAMPTGGEQPYDAATLFELNSAH